MPPLITPWLVQRPLSGPSHGGPTTRAAMPDIPTVVMGGWWSDDGAELPGHAVPAAPDAADGWRGELIRDEHGNPVGVVAVRIGPTWTDSVAVESEHRCVAMRHRTRDSELIVPAEPMVWRRAGPGLAAEPPDGSGAVWQRDGRCVDVLAELLELPTT